MANFAELIGNDIHFYERTLVDTKSLADFIEQFQPQQGWVSSRLPEGITFVANMRDITIYVVERPPRFETIHVGYGLEDLFDSTHIPVASDDDGYAYRVPIPWEYYFMAVTDKSIDTGFGGHTHQASALTLLWSANQVRTLEQPAMHPANLPNTGGSGAVCMGENSSAERDPDKKMIDTVFNFYESTFNSDLGAGSGPCDTLHSWLSYADNHDTVDLTDPVFNLPIDRGVNMLEMLSADNFLRLGQPDEARGIHSTRSFLERLMTILPEHDGTRLMSLLRDVVPAPEEASPDANNA